MLTLTRAAARFQRARGVRSAIVGWLAFGAVAGSALPARAAETGPPDTRGNDTKTIVTQGEPPDAPAARPTNGYWSKGSPRWFLSTKSDVGGVYVKPYFSVGYGLPHWIWAGLDLNAITTLEFTQVYGGVRGSTPVFDLAFGVRDTYSFWKTFLEPRASFVASDVRGQSRNARYWAWEAEAVGVLPLPHSAILLDYVAVRVLDLPANRYLYEESYRAIVAQPFFQVIRAAVVLRLLREDALKIGVLGEVVTTTGRGESVFRMGPAASLQITDHLEMLGTLSVKVASPDHLGLALGAYGVSGFRYRWATGEPKPKFPWRGRLIP